MERPNVELEEQPTVYVIAGPNGAGKTTFARRFLAAYAGDAEFINADQIAAGLAPVHVDSVAIQAGRLMLERIHHLSAQRVSFSFETTLAGRGHLILLSRLIDEGYIVHLTYLWLPDVSLSLARVRARVEAGGHDVPEHVVRRRFDRSFSNFRGFFAKIASEWWLFDNSAEPPRLLAQGSRDHRLVFDEDLFAKIWPR